MPTLIGINGPMTSGKDTAYSFIQQWAEERGVSTCRRGFADLLKWSAYRIFVPDATIDEGVAWANEFKWSGVITAVMPRSEDNKDLEESWQISGRQLLQHYGTECHRDVFDPEFWVNALLPFGQAPGSQYAGERVDDKWHANFDHADICCITDLRFENEAERIKHMRIVRGGGYVLEIERPGIEREAHISEAKLPRELVDITINNAGTLEQFRDNVIAFAASVVKA